MTKKAELNTIHEEPKTLGYVIAELERVYDLHVERNWKHIKDLKDEIASLKNKPVAEWYFKSSASNNKLEPVGIVKLFKR